MASIPPKHSRLESKENDKGVDFFAQPGNHWCPWGSNSCSRRLAVSGQGTVEIMLRKAIPFQLYLSNKEDPQDRNAYKIFLFVDAVETKIGVSDKVFDSSKLTQHILQSEDEKWHTYWLSLFKDTRNVKYGIGEVRAAFTIFNVFLPDNEINQMKEVCYLHVQMGQNDRMLKDLNSIKDEVRFYTGKEPIVYDPAIFVVPQDKYSIELQSAIPPSKLERPCRDLYDGIINFRLNTHDFPDFVQAIEHSVKNPNGWCHQKLLEKANRFGRPNPQATYLRITYGKRTGTSPGHAYVIEIWPPGHYSPIHNHSNAYGIIRVLSGRLLVKIYPQLTLNASQYSPIEQILEEGQVTWMLPKLNQTHQVRNPDLYGNCAISIQCYQYGEDDQLHYEYFDYISNDGLSIAHFDPKSDMDYDQFKQLIKQESNKR